MTVTSIFTELLSRVRISRLGRSSGTRTSLVNETTCVPASSIVHSCSIGTARWKPVEKSRSAIPPPHFDVRTPT